jgi:hypothetical protein
MRIPTGPLDPTIRALFDPDSLPDKDMLNSKGYINSTEDAAPPSKWITPETMRAQEQFLLKREFDKIRRRKYRTVTVA